MRKFYSLVLAILMTNLGFAQCTVSLVFSIDGNVVTANVTGTGAASPSYAIEWGDGTQDLAMSGTHTYADGTYNICGGMFDMNNPLGCAVTDCYSITIGQGGGTDCTLNFTPIISGLNVAINASGTGADTPIYSISWGDNSPIESSATGYHTYAAEGDYTICVTYADNVKGGCTVENCQTVTIAELQTDCTVELTVTADASSTVVTVNAVGIGAENPQYVIAWGNGGIPTIGATGTFTYTVPGSYDICVTYVDVNNIAACNVTACETVDVTIGVEEWANQSSELEVFPSPATEQLTVQLKGAPAEQLQLEILDMKGRLVQNHFIGHNNGDLRQINVNIAELGAGIYVVRVRSEYGTLIERFTK
jgi:hypothetical protein